MSQENPDWIQGKDLIDFEVGSPDLPPGPLATASEHLSDDAVSETLIDSELLRLERTLQTATSTPHCRSRCNSKDSVELEQILITIDDNTSPRRSSYDNIQAPTRNLKTSPGLKISPGASCDHLEISSALEELDKIISESTNSCHADLDQPDEVDGLVSSGDDEVSTVEDCLRELDNYLQGFDTSGSEVADLENLSDLMDLPDPDSGVDLIVDRRPKIGEGSLKGLKAKLKRLASRSRSLRQGRSNFGYEAQDLSGREAEGPRRPLSTDWDQALRRSKLRSTIAACRRKTSVDNMIQGDEGTRGSNYGCEVKEVSGQEAGGPRRPVSADWDQGLRKSKLRATFSSCGRNVTSADNVVQGSNYGHEVKGVSGQEAGGPRRPVSADWDRGLRRSKLRATFSSCGRNVTSIDNMVLGIQGDKGLNYDHEIKGLSGQEAGGPRRPVSADWDQGLRRSKLRATFSSCGRNVTLADNMVQGSNYGHEVKGVSGQEAGGPRGPVSTDWDLGLRGSKLRATFSSYGRKVTSVDNMVLGIQGDKGLNYGHEAKKLSGQKGVGPRRPVSADWDQGLRRSKLRATVGSCGRNVSSVENVARGIPGDEETDDEDIDWSWVQEVAHDSSPKGLCATGGCSSGTEPETLSGCVLETVVPVVDLVTVIACSGAEMGTEGAASAPQGPQVSEDPARSLGPAEMEGGRQSSWLRSSMRRVRHFRLPSDPALSDLETVSGLVGGAAGGVVDPVVGAVGAAARAVVPNREGQRPLSAPARSRSAVSQLAQRPNGEVSRQRSGSESSRSRRSRSRPRSLSSSESSLASSVETSPSCTPASSPTHAVPANPVENTAATPANGATRRACDRQRESTSSSGTASSMPEAHSPLGQWPHGLSSMLACLGCTLGLFNLSRFAVLSVHFGANFILQFLILSLVIGVPLFTLQLCLGQQLGAGVVDMWRISPLFQGVGIALLAAQALVGLYSIVGVSWMFIYFRDSFITKQDQYRWAQTYEYYREDGRSAMNGTVKISETVPDYFSGIVLQRHNLVTGNSFGAIKFQVAFNLAVVWMIVFVSLSKGLRSYAKVVYVFTLLPIFGTFVLCAKLLGMTPNDSLHEVFPETSWAEFFLNSKSWIAASQEAFLTWGLLGAAVMQLSSHNKHKHLLQRDSSLVIILTITILLLTAFLANTCVEILHFYGYNYLPNSFERISTYVFLRPTKDPLPPSLSSTPVRYMTHSSFIIGEKVIRPGMDRTSESGYQVLRFATELVPATLALLGPTQISPFWAVLFYFILILFGIAQQLAIWHCVITGIMAIRAKVLKSWETTITFFTCTFGFILGLPMTTEMGIFVVYFLDYVVGGTWWLIFVYLIQIVAVFMVRGRPYSGDTVVTALFTSASSSCIQTWLAPLLSFTWNVVLPVALMVICITQFKTGNFKELFVWHHAPSLEYWPTWTRQIGSLLQLMPILCIPVVAIVQSYRYLNNGPPDILDRIQLLYRPPLGSEHLDDLTIQQSASAGSNATSATTAVTTIPAEDPPPKYTPPPSYTTATGARIAKLLRQSIRRSVRRLANVLGESSSPRGDRVGERPHLDIDRSHLQVPPPDYSAVLVEMNQGQSHVGQTSISVPMDSSSSERLSRDLGALQGSPLTAADVASILRSSFRRSTIQRQRPRANLQEEIPSGSLSVDCLVDGIAPLGEDSLVLDTISSRNNDTESSKPADDRSSVI